jgi:futalosine hydrolase
MSANLLICVATDLESQILRERLATSTAARVVVTGVGPVNAAHAVTVAVLQERPAGIVVCGVGGAYPSARIDVGGVVAADPECYGDLGAASPSGFLDMKALGFPAAKRVKFVTVSTCTGTDAAARSIAARTGGAVENMEGAAVAHVAHLHRIPVGELRGISNIVTDRDPTSWRLKEAATAAQETLLAWLNNQR